MSDQSDNQVRILHVVASMDRGGLETFLMNVLRRIDRQRFRLDFCPTRERPGQYDEEIRSLGSRIIPCPRDRGLRAYTRRLAEILRHGNYDVVHSHLYTFSGIVLRVAHRCGMPHRFAHLHTSADDQPGTPARIVYRSLMRWLVRRHSTRVLACAGWVMTNFVGSGWQDHPARSVVYYGIHLDPFDAPADRPGVRAEFGLPADCPLLIHVGRFIPAKNHAGLVRIFGEVNRQRTETRLLLVGEGELLEDTRTRVNEAKLADRVVFAGVRSDVARLMKAADVLVMPSTREGMPVTMLEGTAAGLPIVISDMPGMREANDVCCQGTLLPMDAPPERWASEVLAALDASRPDPVEALARVRQSPFASDAAARTLEQVYAACARPPTARQSAQASAARTS